MTKQQKKKALFFSMSWIIAIIVIIILCQNTRLQKPSNNVWLMLTEIEKQMAACEEKIINDFQLVEPEFVWNSDNDINWNSLKWHVIYQESNSVNTTEFECKVWNNWKDVWINWDRSNNPSSDDIIYDDRE